MNPYAALTYTRDVDWSARGAGRGHGVRRSQPGFNATAFFPPAARRHDQGKRGH